MVFLDYTHNIIINLLFLHIVFNGGVAGPKRVPLRYPLAVASLECLRDLICDIWFINAITINIIFVNTFIIFCRIIGPISYIYNLFLLFIS